MKHIKTIENNYDKVKMYWKVSLRQPYFSKALEEIGMYRQKIRGWAGIKDKYADTDKEIFMFYDRDDDRWTWSELDFEPYTDDYRAEYMGDYTKIYFDTKSYNL